VAKSAVVLINLGRAPSDGLAATELIQPLSGLKEFMALTQRSRNTVAATLG
jgi:hypothetical protein